MVEVILRHVRRWEPLNFQLGYPSLRSLLPHMLIVTFSSPGLRTFVVQESFKTTLMYFLCSSWFPKKNYKVALQFYNKNCRYALIHLPMKQCITFWLYYIRLTYCLKYKINIFLHLNSLKHCISVNICFYLIIIHNITSLLPNGNMFSRF